MDWMTRPFRKSSILSHDNKTGNKLELMKLRLTFFRHTEFIFPSEKFTFFLRCVVLTQLRPLNKYFLLDLVLKGSNLSFPMEGRGGIGFLYVFYCNEYKINK